MMTTPPLERISVTTGELAGLLGAAGITPTPNSPLPAPEPGGPEPDEQQALLLNVAADPTGTMRIVGPGGDRGLGITTSLLWSDPRGPFVIATPTTTGFDLTMLANRSMALSWLDRALMVSRLPSPSATDRLDLDLPAYAALLALADAVTEVRLREQLERRQQDVPALTLEQLRSAFDTGMQTTDDRWAVSGTRLVCPVDLASAADELEAGTVRLTELGLTMGDATGLGITQQGAPFVSSLASQPRSTGLATAVVDDGGIDVGHLTAHRSPVALHLVVWKALGDAPRLSLSQPSAARFLDLVDGLITRR